MLVFGNEKFANKFLDEKIFVCDENLPSPVKTHPDMNLCIIDDTVFLPPNSNLIDLFVTSKFSVVTIKTPLGNTYPYDVPLNCAVGKNTVILNEKTVAPEILSFCKLKGKEIICVNQGYASCSCVVIDDNTFITADNGIYGELIKHKKTALLISAGYIQIDEYDYGFIGGASGFIGGVLHFFGDITAHPDYHKIDLFLKQIGVKYEFYKNEPLTDIGSVYEF